MLKGLDPLLTPALLEALAEMGHGDRIALVDRNYPAYSTGLPVVDLPQVTLVQALGAILQIFPIDAFPNNPVVYMLTDDGHDGPGLASCRSTWDAVEGRAVEVAGVLRHGPDGFYAQARDAYIVVQTGETVPYSCYLIPKGVL